MSPITHRRVVKSEGADYYPTPAWATRALLAYEKFEGTILEPCCGDGAMSKVLVETENPIMSSDLYDRGYGAVRDVFNYSEPVDNVVTNPPFNIATDIILHMMPLFRKKMAFFLRTAFLESVSRYNMIYSVHPPSRVHVFTKRVTLYPVTHENKTNGGTTSYAWFVWERDKPTRTELNWISPTIGQD